jgi:hypothetical protein
MPNNAGSIALDDDTLRMHPEYPIGIADSVDRAAQHIDAGEMAGKLLVAHDIVAEQRHIFLPCSSVDAIIVPVDYFASGHASSSLKNGSDNEFGLP